MTTTQVTLPPLPVDHSYSQQTEEEEHEEVEVYEEEHHTWFGGSTAVKYLLAGGVAGAGEHISSLWPFPPDQLVPSFANLHCTVRSAEDIPNHSTTRSSSRLCVKILRYEGDDRCGNEDIRRKRCSRILDRKRTVGCKDPS
jgi:hypothetical protein